MEHIIPRRDLIDRIRLGLSEYPVVALLGARQVGKTTLARLLQESSDPVSVFDLERPTGRAALETTPELALSSATGLVIIDEVQRLPSLFEILRPICDDPGRRAKFLLLGSASPDIVRGVSESLAGRVQFVFVPGLALTEVGADKQDQLWLRGGFPRSFLASSDAASDRWRESFRRTFLERDIPNLGLRVPALALDRFWTMLAHYHGQVWNASELARSLDVSAQTANRYRDLLAGTFVVRVLHPWFENISKRQVKSPKVYLRDSGLLHHLLGIDSMASLRSHPRYGASWEGFAIEQVLARFSDRDAYFWSTTRGAELDLVLLRQGHRWGFEFKCSDAPLTTRSMHIALADLGLDHLWVIYPGKTRYSLNERITVLPLSEVGTLPIRPAQD